LEYFEGGERFKEEKGLEESDEDIQIDNLHLFSLLKTEEDKSR
jgi:hypothetical protein